jgi:N-acetylglucosamine kinase-like BadF-type ATPase
MKAISRRVAGLDIGGSKTHALAVDLADGDRAPREVMAGSANLSSVGAAEVTRQLASVFDALGRDGITAVCVGAAGVDSPQQEQRLRTLVQAQVPGSAVRIVHDTELILAAAGVEQGIALIAGTGSVAWGRSADGSTARAGGWGYLLGDKGSGYWLGQHAVRHALALADRRERPDELADRLTADCGLQRPGQLLDHFYANPERSYWAGHSRLVFELAAAGDRVAAHLVDLAATALADIAAVVGMALGVSGPVLLGGGLLDHQPRLQLVVQQRLSASGLPDSRVLDRAPAHGALLLARRLAASAGEG